MDILMFQGFILPQWSSAHHLFQLEIVAFNCRCHPLLAASPLIYSTTYLPLLLVCIVHECQDENEDEPSNSVIFPPGALLSRVPLLALLIRKSRWGQWESILCLGSGWESRVQA